MRGYVIGAVLLVAACGPARGGFDDARPADVVDSAAPLDGPAVVDAGPDVAPEEAGADALAEAAVDAPREAAADVAIDRPPGCVDADGDGHGAVGCGGDDCNDADPAIHPGAEERCNGIDDNCNGLGDESGPALDDYCVRTAPGVVFTEAPPLCAYPTRPAADAFGVPYERLTVARCEACRRDASSAGGWDCICWDAAGASGLCPYPP